MLRGQETLQNAVRLVDGDYVVVLAVYHELHCLVWLYTDFRISMIMLTLRF